MKRDPVLIAALAAATASAFFVPPSKDYWSYLDLRVLGLLLALMLVVAGLKKAGVFALIIDRLLGVVRTARALAFVLVGTCFFASMLITNDVALITFVPLGMMLLIQARLPGLLIPVIVLQTVAGNLGSMLTPLGNPQNLYLFAISGLSAGQFLLVMAMPAALSFLLLAGSVFLIRPSPVAPAEQEAAQPSSLAVIIAWVVLFLACLLAVLRVIPCVGALAAVIVYAVFFDRLVLRRADYGLLLTFVFLFILIGNLKNIPAVSTTLSAWVGGREIAAGILLSQVISNVPAAMLLSKFTVNYSALLVGVNVGGLGTLIASMASLISYKLYTAADGAKPGRYLAVFTAVNLLFLALLWGAAALFAAA